MTEFIVGSSGTGKGSLIVERIRERLGNGRKKYLIVPEQQAVLWEARICRALPPSSALELEVVGFRRLADTVFRSVGGLWRSFTGEAKKILLMWSALSALSGELKVYGSSGGHEDRYVSMLLDTLGDTARRGVTPVMLGNAADKLGEGALSDKLSDLSLIFSAYRALEAELESEDPDLVLDMLAKTLRTHRHFKGCDVFIDSFYSFTPVENEILYYIMKDSEDLIVTFTFDPDSVSRHFDHVRKFFDGASSLAASCGRDVTVTRLSKNYRCDKEDILFLEKNLWDFSSQAAGRTDGSVRLIRCRDRYEEARAASSLIEKYVHGGASYSDIAVVAADIETYRGIIDVMLDRAGIPYYLSKRSGISNSSALALFTSLLDAASDGCRPQSVMKCLKTGLFAPPAEDVAAFEEYCRTWNIRGAGAFLRDADWRMNPSGYKRERTERDESALASANRVRRALAEPLGKVTALFKGGKAKIADVCRTLYEIAQSLGIYEKLSEQDAALGTDERTKAYAAVIGALDAMAKTLPDDEITTGGASRLIFTLAGAFDVGSIPNGVDVVTLGSATGLRCSEIRHVILLGAVEGEFPASLRDTGLLTRSDKAELDALGISLSDGDEAERAEELFRFWRCVTMASESADVIFPAKTEDGAVSPSIAVRRIMKLLNLQPEDFSALPVTEKVWSARGAAGFAAFPESADLSRAASKLSDEFPELIPDGRLSAALSADREKIGKAASDKISGRRLSLTQSRIDRFSECPFSYYAKYVLKLGEENSASLGAVDVGNLVHRILELFFLRTSGREFPLGDDETEKIVDEIISEYLSQIMSGAEATSRQRYLFGRLRRNVLILIKELMTEFAETSFRPYRFELPMGSDPGSPAPLEFLSSDGTKVSLFGTIDRVDTFDGKDGVYVRVVDYKTFGKNFRMSDVERGVNLQLLIYLFTLWKSGGGFRGALEAGGKKILPGGMIYLSSAPDSASSDVPLSAEAALKAASETVKRSGVVLDSPEVICAMGGDGRYLPAKRVVQLSLDGFEELFGKVEEVIREIADSIRGGDAASRPAGAGSSSPCRYCKMKPVCRHIEERGVDDE